MKDIITYYEDGGNSNTEAAVGTEMKRQAKKWQEILKKEFYDEKNAIGRRAMYIVLKKKYPTDYPTKRFVGAWLRRQISNQVHRTAPKSAPSIQSVIVSKPNELLQVDFMYFYRHLTGEPLVADADDADAKQIAKNEKLLAKKNIVYQGCITAIDCFSRVGYALPIKGNINSKKAFKALQEIIKMARDRYKTEIKKIQTDKGSEFQLHFRKGVKELSEEHKGFYKHHYGFTGRSQTQGLVERFNGTLKRMLQRHLNFKLGTEWWKDGNLQKALDNYNSNPHRVIKMAPDDVDPANYTEVKQNILDRAKKSKRFQGVVYKVGDVVRLKIYKPKRLKPNFTFKKGPLYAMTNRAVYKGIYMINKINIPEGKNSIGKAPTYSIIAKWSKEETPDWYETNQELGGTLPSGVKIKDEVVNIPGNVLDGEQYERGAFPRKFVKDELVRVPVDRKGIPLAEGNLYRQEEEEEEEAPATPKPTKPKPAPQPVIIHPSLKVGSQIEVSFYDSGQRPYTQGAAKRKVGKKRQFYEGKVTKIDKEQHEYSVYFESDKETVILNLSDTSEDDYLKEGKGWRKR